MIYRTSLITLFKIKVIILQDTIEKETFSGILVGWRCIVSKSGSTIRGIGGAT